MSRKAEELVEALVLEDGVERGGFWGCVGRRSEKSRRSRSSYWDPFSPSDGDEGLFACWADWVLKREVRPVGADGVPLLGFRASSRRAEKSFA